MSIDYQAQDEALDDEIRALYAQDDDSEQESDSPDDQDGTESQQNESEQELDDSTLVDEHQEPSPDTVDKSRYDNAVIAMNRAQQELAERRKQDSARDDLINTLQTQLQQQAQQLQSLQQAAPQTASTQQSVDDDDLKEAQELYPEVVTPLLNMIAKLEKKLAAVSDDVGGVRQEVGTVKGVADRYQQSERELANQNYWSVIARKHPDVLEVNESPEFAEWYTQQPSGIQKAVNEGGADEAIAILDMYRASHPRPVPDNDKTSATKADKLAAAKAAAAPTVKGSQRPETKTKFTTAQIAKMSHAEYAKHEAEIDEAMARGEIA